MKSNGKSATKLTSVIKQIRRIRNNTKITNKSIPFVATSLSPIRSPVNRTIEIKSMNKCCKLGSQIQPNSQVHHKNRVLSPISRAMCLIVKKRAGMPQFFSPKRVFSEGKYKKFQKIINQYFMIDKRKKYRNKIAREIMNSTFNFNSNTFQRKDPRSILSKLRTKLAKKSKLRDSRNCSGSKGNNSASQFKQINSPLRGSNEDLSKDLVCRVLKSKVERMNSNNVENHKRLSSIGTGFESNARKQSMLTVNTFHHKFEGKNKNLPSELYSITDEESDYSDSPSTREPSNCMSNSFVRINEKSEEKVSDKSIKCRFLSQSKDPKESIDQKYQISPYSNKDLLKFYPKKILSPRFF